MASSHPSGKRPSSPPYAPVEDPQFPASLTLGLPVCLVWTDEVWVNEQELKRASGWGEAQCTALSGLMLLQDWVVQRRLAFRIFLSSLIGFPNHQSKQDLFSSQISQLQVFLYTFIFVIALENGLRYRNILGSPERHLRVYGGTHTHIHMYIELNRKICVLTYK